MEERDVLHILSAFDVPKGKMTAQSYGNGHINTTYLLSMETAGGVKRYIAQRINRFVFGDPEAVVRNINLVTAYLRGIIEDEGGDPERGTLSLVPAKAGGYIVTDPEGEVWRMMNFIDDTISVDLPDTPELFRLSGAAFGRFQRQMGGFPAEQLAETIADFHNTPARYAQLREAVRRNAAGRLAEVEPELAFCRAREADTHALLDALASGEIPLRVTHNDTKLNNVLLDAKTGEGVCVIDLDTVMPGLAAYDFGDSIRFGANTAEEDERDLSKVSLSLDMYRAFAEGFLGECGDVMSQRERELLPMGAKLMTLECGMRFLADHLSGDKYFRVHRPGQNLDRARTQFALVADMERKWTQMQAIIAEIGG